MGAYPFPLVADKGNRLVVKSKAEEIEYERLWVVGRPARLLLSRGSSCSRDSFRDEEIPEGDDVESVEVRSSGEDDAREASSRESRACCDEGGCRLLYWCIRDMIYYIESDYEGLCR